MQNIALVVALQLQILELLCWLVHLYVTYTFNLAT